MSYPEWHIYCLRVTAESDPGALMRVLERLTNLNIVPRRLVAESATNGVLQIQLHLSGLTEQTVRLITAKLAQVPCILNVYYHS